MTINPMLAAALAYGPFIPSMGSVSRGSRLPPTPKHIQEKRFTKAELKRRRKRARALQLELGFGYIVVARCTDCGIGPCFCLDIEYDGYRVCRDHVPPEIWEKHMRLHEYIEEGIIGSRKGST